MNCKQCQTSFNITPDDRTFLARFAMPDPQKCRRCRQQTRLAWRNERHLYHRTCDLTGKKLINMYSPDKPLKVYDKEVWHSDRWDALEYGRDFDFSRHFFDQFQELQRAVPRTNLIEMGNENCAYVNYVGHSKDCYLIFGSIKCQDCFYGSPYYSKNCVDNERLSEGELCYECVDSKKLYRCIYLQDCSNCSECVFGFDLQGCKDCFGCVGLRNKEYYVFNKPYNKEEYEALIGQFRLNERAHFEAAKKKFQELKMSTPHLSNVILKSENCTGDKIYESRNIHEGFYAERVDEGRYLNYLMDSKVCMDHDYSEEALFCYNVMGGYLQNNMLCCLPNVESNHLSYCDLCFSSNDCFGCVGLKRKKYCILNKQYSKEDYNQMVGQIVDQMVNTGEWGEFFPIEKSLFAYNETVANDEYYPLSKEQVLKKNWQWLEESSDKPLQNIVYDEGVHQCQTCHKPFRLISGEVSFYKTMGIPLPDRCSLCRYKNRIQMRNPRELFARECDRCKKSIQSTYAPEREEGVYCEGCYLKEIY